ncbi:hypothetical protein J6B78_08085 [Methanocorpusculum sp.]|nr:hypothetical protein [Methanocorpusculum sp.]
MSLTQGFCPKCGAPSDNGELCGKCKAKDLVWIEIPPRIECTICPSCDSVKPLVCGPTPQSPART